jgi:hypothetical protein
MTIKDTYLTPKNFGLSPGAVHVDSTNKLWTWARDKTVAATTHGKPIMEQIPMPIATTVRSKW